MTSLDRDAPSWKGGITPSLARKKIATQIDAGLHRQPKVLSAVTGRRIDSLIEEVIRNLTAHTPTGDFVTFEQMHAEYQRRLGATIDIAAEAERLQRRRGRKRG